jgi:hypothetical protein
LTLRQPNGRPERGVPESADGCGVINRVSALFWPTSRWPFFPIRSYIKTAPGFLWWEFKDESGDV